MFGLAGRLTFTISQTWLRRDGQAVGHRRATAPPLVTTAAARAAQPARQRGAALQSLRGSRTRPRRPHRPHLGRRDIESFLHRMSEFKSRPASAAIGRGAGRTSPEGRQAVPRPDPRARAEARPGGPAAGLGCDSTLACGDIPAEPERGRTSAATLSASIMAQPWSSYRC